MSVVTATPGESATDSLEPGVGGNGDNQELAQRMEDGPPPALPKAVGHREAKGKNDGDFDPENRVARKEEQKDKRAHQDHRLEYLKEDESAEPPVESRIEVFREAVP